MASALGRKPCQIKVQRHARAAELADDGGHGCAGGAGKGFTAVAEDEDGVQHDVDDGTDELAAHAQVGAARCGQQLFAHGLHKQAKAEHRADGQVADALLDDLRIVGLCIEVGLHAGQANDKKYRKAAKGEEDAVFGGLVGAVLVLFAEALGQQRVDADTGADADRDHDVLQGKGQRNGGQGALADVGHEDGVHDVVQRLYQHRDHHRDAQFDEQGVDGHGAHDVFLRSRGGCLLCFHDCSLLTNFLYA